MSMPIKIHVCDDEKDMRSLLSSHLNRIADELQESFCVDLFPDAELLLASPDEADILLLDISMEPIDGMEAARILRDRGNKSTLIFITTMTQFALQGYEVHAYGFLEKPVFYEKLKVQIMEAIRIRRAMRGERYEIRNGAALTAVNLNKVVFFEVFHHNIYAAISDSTKNIPCSVSLGDLELELKGRSFFRCHKSYLINLRHVVQIDSTGIILSNGQSVPLSRYKKASFLDAFARYRGGLV